MKEFRLGPTRIACGQDQVIIIRVIIDQPVTCHCVAVPAQSRAFKVFGGEFWEDVSQTVAQLVYHLFGDVPFLSAGSQFGSWNRDFGTALTVGVARSVDGDFDKAIRVRWKDVKAIVETEVLRDEYKLTDKERLGSNAPPALWSIG